MTLLNEIVKIQRGIYFASTGKNSRKPDPDFIKLDPFNWNSRIKHVLLIKWIWNHKEIVTNSERIAELHNRGMSGRNRVGWPGLQTRQRLKKTSPASPSLKHGACSTRAFKMMSFWKFENCSVLHRQSVFIQIFC